MVDRLIRTPVFDSIVSHNAIISLCTRFPGPGRPARIHSSDRQILTSSCSLCEFDCILNVIWTPFDGEFQCGPDSFDGKYKTL